MQRVYVRYIIFKREIRLIAKRKFKSKLFMIKEQPQATGGFLQKSA